MTQPTLRGNHPPIKMISNLGIVLGVIVLVCMQTVIAFPDPLVNWFVRPRIEKAAAKGFPAWSIRVAAMSYSLLANRFGFESVTLRSADSTLTSTIGPISVSGIRWLHLFWGGALHLQISPGLV